MGSVEGNSLENANPRVFEKTAERIITEEEENDDFVDAIDDREIFDYLRMINDPEHPLTLEQLNVVEQSKVKSVLLSISRLPEKSLLIKCKKNCENETSVENNINRVTVHFTPTIPHCSMATLIGLSIRVKLLRILPPRFKVDVVISPGTHVSEAAINKQLADKERVAAALENSHLMQVINQCLKARTD